MTNGTRHDPCIPRHWAMRCPAWTSTRTSHNRVINKIRPNTDVASISSVLHLVWPLAQSLSSMVVPTRSQNSSWHSLWDLQGTQAPQLRQSNNTLGGFNPEGQSPSLQKTIAIFTKAFYTSDPSLARLWSNRSRVIAQTSKLLTGKQTDRHTDRHMHTDEGNNTRRPSVASGNKYDWHLLCESQ